MDRQEAIMCIVGAVKGYTIAEKMSKKDSITIIKANFNALTVLGVSIDEINNAIRSAPFLGLLNGENDNG